MQEKQNNSIQEKTLSVLEYPKIISRLADQALTEPGRELCFNLKPQTDSDIVMFSLEETDDMVRLLLQKGELPLSGVEKIRHLIAQMISGRVPGCPEFLRFSRFLRAVGRIRTQVPADYPEPDGERLVYERIILLQPLKPVLKRLEECIAGEDEVHDRATEELYLIRRRINRAQQDIKSQLDRILKHHAQALQDQIVTLRGDRYVVPVKSEHKSAIPGLVHDTSASGATFFIEPLAVVELNNRIRELKVAERDEIQRIFQELSDRIVAEQVSFNQNAELLAQIDFAQAKGKLALLMEAMKPRINCEGRIILRRARHPLIDAKQVVPINFELGTDFKTLVITGPNTGGKTVTLKTCGLLTLMAMAGLHIPTADNSEISIFGQVLADIGDEQSIEQNLSTFSSHLKQIIRITELASESTLVLTDELGAGTDPSEGAALAIAILDFLRQKGCHTVATTHYKELKGYALNTAGVQNASCEFDTQTLRPTYHLLIGVPGVSNAFAISQRLGLNQSIISDAEALISDEGAQFEELVSAIERSHQQAEEMRLDIERLKNESVALKAQLQEEQAAVRKKRVSLLEKAREEAAQIIADAQNEVDEMLELLRLDLQNAQTAQARRTAHEVRSLLNEKTNRLREQSGKDKLKQAIDRPLTVQDIVVGQYYHSVLLNVTGQAVDKPDGKQNVALKSGVMTVTVPLASLRPAEDPANRTVDQSSDRSRRRSKRADVNREIVSQRKRNITTELKLLGLTVDEALYELDRFLDDAVLANLSAVRIVHGKGTGALRNAVQSRLRSDSRVKAFRLAAHGEGDSGVTIAEL